MKQEHLTIWWRPLKFKPVPPSIRRRMKCNHLRIESATLSNSHHSHKGRAYTYHMNKTEAVQLAKKLAAKHGFGHLEITTSRTKRALGRCFFKYGKPIRIDLSAHWISHLDEPEIRDTILHEIAHAIAGHKAGHGADWKRAAIAVGANPSRTAELPREVSESFGEKHYKYIAVCNGCENRVYFDRFGKNWRNNRYTCSKCGSRFTVYSNR